MAATKQTMKMPELMVFAKMFVVGLVAAEVCRTTYYLGTAFAPAIADFSLWARAILVPIGLAVCVVYVVNRGGHISALQMGRSRSQRQSLASLSGEIDKTALSDIGGALRAEFVEGETDMMRLQSDDGSELIVYAKEVRAIVLAAAGVHL